MEHLSVNYEKSTAEPNNEWYGDSYWEKKQSPLQVC